MDIRSERGFLMTLLTMNASDRFVANSTEIFQSHGVKLEVGYDFEVYRTILAEARPDHILGDPFDPNLHDMTPENAFWIVGRTSEGKVMHTQALRMLNLDGLSVGEYFTRSFREFPPSGVDLDLRRSRFRAGPSAKKMRGTCAYQGEYWIAPGNNGLRGRSLSGVLGRYAFVQAIQHWDPDHITAFMVKATAMRGLAEQGGYMHTQPGALRWYIRGNETPVEGFLLHMDRDDLHFVLNLPIKEFVALAA